MRKDASTVPADPHGKRQHVVEILTIIDKGTSVLVAHHVRADFTAETASFGCRTDVRLHMDYLPPLLWTVTPAGLEPPKAVTFLLPWCAFVTPWESLCVSAIRIIHTKMGLWNAITARSIRSA